MSGARILEFGSELEFGNLEFSDLKSRLESYLEQSKSGPDLERLTKSLNPLLKADKFSPEEHYELKKLRQRAYDRRRNPKMTSKTVQISKSRSDSRKSVPRLRPLLKESISYVTPCQETNRKVSKMPLESVNSISRPGNSSLGEKQVDFVSGIKVALAKLDGEKFARTLPGRCVLLGAVALVSAFLWQQSVGLYASAGFRQPHFVAAGSLLMIVGFAANYALSKSKLALLLCLYAGAYETYFVISGTFKDEAVVQEESLQSNPRLVFLRETTEKTREAYHAAKTRYDDPTSKVYRNDWYRKTYIDTAWHANEEAHGALLAEHARLQSQGTFLHVTWLKVLYRLGLVFLCMVLVHRLVTNFRTPFQGKHQ